MIPDDIVPITAVKQGFVLLSRRLQSMGSNPVPGRGPAVLAGDDKPEARGVTKRHPMINEILAYVEKKGSKLTWPSNMVWQSTCLQKS